MTEHATIGYQALGQVLWLLAASVLVVALLRRVNLPTILGYLAVGMALGPHALGFVESAEDTRLLAEFGVVFLLFTLGLEFSLPRMIAMKSEVFALGASQMLGTALAGGVVGWWIGGLDAGVSIVVGGAVAMSSTAIVIKQLTEQLEVGRVHGRLAVGILLFQDLAAVPFLVLIAALAQDSGSYQLIGVAATMLQGAAAVVVVLLAGRYLLRPLFHEIAHARIAELFTLAVLLVALGAAWATHAVGLSLALGAFLAGMMLAETEYRHQIEMDIRPFRDVLLGLFFITVGMLVDFRTLLDQPGLVAGLVGVLVLGKAALTTLLARGLAGDWNEACRSALVTAQGGEFGIALLTLSLQAHLIESSLGQRLLAAIVISMAISPLLIRHNARLAALLFGDREGAARQEVAQDLAVKSVAMREHVIICGFGRVGQNVARILEEEGYEYIALDLDPFRVRSARQAGDPVFFGNAERTDILHSVGLANASVVVISFADPVTALKIVAAVKEARPDVAVLVRTQDDSYLDQLQQAGATAVVPETLEASLMLVSHVLALLRMPVTKIVRKVQDIRDHRYGLLRSIFRKEAARPLDASHALREQLQTVSLPPGAYAVGKTLAELELEQAEVVVTAIRRDGIVGRQPAAETRLREGDVLVLYGTPEALEHGETILLSG